MTPREQGKIDYHAWMSSKHYAQFDHSIAPEEVMKIFLPPVPQDMMQMQRPLPPPWREWLEGFKEEMRR